MSSAVPAMFIFCRMLALCVLTVFTDRLSCAPMSEMDLPARLSRYDGDHVKLRRIALTRTQVRGLLSFPATDKKKDPRYKWFRANYGDSCWELDAMDPNDLRDCVEKAIQRLVEPIAWQRCETINRVEQESLKTILQQWGGAS